MVCSVHQPNFAPYFGFFHKFSQSDIFVLYDTAQYSKGDFHNRNRIKTSSGLMWLTVPVHVQLGQRIREVTLADPAFVRSHLHSLSTNYRLAHCFETVFNDVEQVYQVPSSMRLVDFNQGLLRLIFERLGCHARVVLASDLDLDPETKGSEALAQIVSLVGASTYLSGPGARNYLDERTFLSRGIIVSWQKFQTPVYDQRWGEFQPNLSVLDALFNVGFKGLRRLLDSTST